MHLQCSAYHVDSALEPVIQQLLRAAAIQAADPEALRLEKLELLLAGAGREDMALIAALLGVDGSQRFGSLNLTPQQQRSRLFDALFSQLRRLAEERPIIWVLEDAHWIDPTTLEMMQRVISQVETLKLLAVITSRSDIAPGFDRVPIVHIDLPAWIACKLRRSSRVLTRGKGVAGRSSQRHLGESRRHSAVRRGTDQSDSGIECHPRD